MAGPAGTRCIPAHRFALELSHAHCERAQHGGAGGQLGDKPALFLKHSSRLGFSACFDLERWHMDLNRQLSRHGWGEARQRVVGLQGDLAVPLAGDGFGAHRWTSLPGIPHTYWKGHLGGDMGLISGTSQAPVSRMVQEAGAVPRWDRQTRTVQTFAEAPCSLARVCR